ncbi:1,2-phenylacetyl-CoA epoxidase subunit PaaE [Flaviaesturariibacter aridisoli]|uniref:Phenylacetate-CoA oxygenase/reductase subunit PaaK n=1 Tax=Flaviaesturariibacter aridisoli TaxID=2545761 RepID=A0A4R4E4P2_9BACT|nr:1,2-phenylacetyl-CoA epoxidase subunit PaaE [Flaviaesturariibacter aridisoli]TCZ72190.1 phenylacetate-CoA oxygenase/reductase subunit PaaK [Flaviaesturariibacter aridisoli]
MIHFHPLTVKKVQRETDDCVSITFQVPPELQEAFRFRAGQNLTIRKTFNGEEQRRSYSLCSGAGGPLRVAIKRVEGGLFSSWANESLKPGDVLEVLPPTGNFCVDLDAANKKHYLFFAAGSGITPVLSLLQTILAAEPGSRCTLVFGNRSKNSIIFKEELEALKDKYIDRFRLYHVLSREKTDVALNSGRIDRAKCELLFDKVIDRDRCDAFFVCGPEEMIFTVRDYLREAGVAPKKIHYELFTVPGQKKSNVETEKEIVSESGPRAQVQVKLDGIAFDFDLAYDGHSVLDAALKQGADLPYACKGGVCCTCKAKLLEGEVVMDENWGLEPDEVAAGFILTCQSHPRSERIVVDFDAK